ncbi:MAG: c-type cytochrome biogenesis protein CcmF, partial [Gammaproteobacteria bacterium]|nr:c-type cytochrome biogenesis protein CcmF [Gammaproteobacteria bacterium]
TFLVRSGVLTSVHAFATDPGRGIFILLFLCVVIGGSLLLYSWRASQIRSSIKFSLISRDTGLLMNNVFLVVACASVLLGTLYPLVLDALGVGKISVGPPYFNSVFIPLTIPLAIFIGVGPLARWKEDSAERLVRKLAVSLLVSLAAGFGLTLLLAPQFNWGAALGLVLAIWVVLTTILWLVDRAGGRRSLLQMLLTLPRGGWGMMFGHLGVAVFIVGITLTSIYSTEKDLRLERGQSYSLGGYDFLFQGAERVKGPNYVAHQAVVEVSRDGKPVALLHPQKRNYQSGMPMTEAGIDAGLTRDLFVALGEPLGDQGAWSLRIYHKPFIRWIWLGFIFMAVGGVLAATDRRYFQLARKARAVAGHQAMAGTA